MVGLVAVEQASRRLPVGTELLLKFSLTPWAGGDDDFSQLT
jgi:hypothetical protein